MIQILSPRERPTSDGAKRRPVAGRLGPERSGWGVQGAAAPPGTVRVINTC
jgi:hypothetical protein